MKIRKMLGFLTAVLLLFSVAACGPTYVNNSRPGYSGRYHHHHGGYGYGRPVPQRPYGGGYNRGW